MTDLAALQKSFQSAVTEGNVAFRNAIRATGRVSAQTRIGIYADAYRLRLIEALAENYPGLVKLLGDSGFDALARAYIESHPSGFRSIRWFGDRLPEFIAGYYESGESRELIEEMALTDWLMGLAFDAADPPTVKETDMAAFPAEAWGDLTFEFHPGTHRLDLRHAVIPFRATDDAELSRPERHARPVAWLVWRQNLVVRFRSLEIDEAFALDAAMAGESFAILCGGITEWIDENHAPMRIAGFLKRWLTDDLITRIALPDL
ncbi:MAG: DUF2063 domain-containing protein [Proteobacteria bacterium]|nr:MAG: DUF2063 domain-containing protein [Pseudomonadota bacterium]